MELQIYPLKKRQPMRLMPIFTKECEKPLKEAASQLNNSIMSPFTKNSKVEEIWTELKNGLKHALSEHVPHKRVKPKPSHTLVDYGTKKLIRRETGSTNAPRNPEMTKQDQNSNH